MALIYWLVLAVTCFALTAVAMYKAKDAGEYGDIAPIWASPLVYLVIMAILGTPEDSFQLMIMTAVNSMACILSGLLIFLPLPENVAKRVKWWYPLIGGVIVRFFLV